MNRKQQVLVEENKSEKSLVTSGAIQGSLLGPVFFLMFVADMKTEVKSKIKLFVDDAKIKSAIKNEGDVEKLQEDMDRLYPPEFHDCLFVQPVSEHIFSWA